MNSAHECRIKVIKILFLFIMLSGNVAYGQTADGSNFEQKGAPAVRALDGNRNPHFDRLTGSCAYMRADDWQTLFWQVDLGSLHVIYNLTVYGTNGWSAYGGMIYLKVYIV